MNFWQRIGNWVAGLGGRELAAVDLWSQLIMKEPGDDVERILAAPATGTYRIADGQLRFMRVSSDWHELTDEHDAFFMRVYAPGDYRFHGADLGVLVTKGRMQTDAGLTDLARDYIAGIRHQYVGEPVHHPEPMIPLPVAK